MAPSRELRNLQLEARAIIGQDAPLDSPRTLRSGGNITPGRGSVTPVPQSPSAIRRREARERRDAAAAAALTAAAALEAVEEAEANVEEEGGDSAEGTEFFDRLAANAGNNGATTGNNHTQEAVEHIQNEADVVQQQTNSRQAYVEDENGVRSDIPHRQGWDFSGLQVPPDTPGQVRAPSQPPAPITTSGGLADGSPSGSNPGGSSGGGGSSRADPSGGDSSGGGGPPDHGIPDIFGDNGHPAECIICTAPIPFSLRCQVQPCGHSLFHTDCIQEYYNFFRRNVTDNPTRRIRDLSCIICRRAVTSLRCKYRVDGSYTIINAAERWPRNTEPALDNLIERMFWRRTQDGASNNQTLTDQTNTGNNQTRTDQTNTGNNQTRTSQTNTGNNQTRTDQTNTGNNQTRTSQNSSFGIGAQQPPAPPSDQSMRDPSPSPAPRVPSGEAPPGWVYDEDRSDLSRKILKEVIGVYSARNRGYRLLLKSESRNLNYPNLPIYDLEPQHRFPGKMQEWQDLNGPILQPAPREDLRGRDWEEFEIKGVANVWQNIRMVDDRVQMPLRNAEAMVLLDPVDRDLAEDWYRLSDVNAEFGANRVRPAVHDHRLKTGQHVPIAPVSRRRLPTSYQTRPLSEFPDLAENMGRRSAPTQARRPPADASDDDLEAFYERQLRELRERRAGRGTTSVPLFFMDDQEGWVNPNRYRVMALEASRRFHQIREERIARGQAPSESTL